jgi:aspartate racemase
MKTIGLLGGMSWESSIEYYRIINETVRQRLGGVHSAESLMFSVDFAEIESLQHAGAWEKLTQAMIEAARRLERGGADGIVICTNTMHRMANDMAAAVAIPILHIADAAAAAIKRQGLKKVGLLGTRFTMQGAFYRQRLTEKHGLEVIIPNKTGQTQVHNIIYQELIQGLIRHESRQVYVEVIRSLQARGAQGVILGCTEIPLLITQKDSLIPVFDTTRIHAEAAVDWALGERL